ncbi:unnamed protein product [Arabis nemorensis]|uniref:Nucleoplasmin-like domain-containing protein n=1 Tax=Arabis nemorensis TaxID=586526 RepID=A0A565APW3_9BRAS|nr:unnamed protein product [Arabis nemorensis]
MSGEITHLGFFPLITEAEVAANKNVDVILGEDELVHISQLNNTFNVVLNIAVSLDFNGYPDGVVKLHLKVDGETYMIGSLSQQKEGYMSLDLIIDENFTLSHSSNRGSVHFIGYKTPNLKTLVNEGIVSIKVADPRPQPAIPNSYRQLHVPRRLRDDFLKLAKSNTVANLETCGLLAGSKVCRQQGNVYQMTTLIIPKQKSTSTSYEMLNEEEVLKVQEDLSLISLGWIHMLLPEAVAIVVAPTDKSIPYGIFHLSDPSGLSMIRNCDQQS